MNEIEICLRICSKCKKELPATKEFFHKNGKYFHSRCKSCSKEGRDTLEYQTKKRKWDRTNYEATLSIRSSRNKKNRERHAILLDQYRDPCKKCGEERKYLIEFHHIDRENKSFTIGEAIGRKREEIILEIQKCVTLCNNCHKEFHYFEFRDNITTEQYLNDYTINSK